MVGSAKTKKARGYVTLTNMTDHIIVLTHPEGGSIRDIVLRVRGNAVIDPEVWNVDDVPHLRELVSNGGITMETVSTRPAPKASLNIKMPSIRTDGEVVRQIVYSHDEAAVAEHINMLAENEGIAGSPVDITFMRQRQKPILESALDAIERMNDSSLAERAQLIRNRLLEIDRMPNG